MPVTGHLELAKVLRAMGDAPTPAVRRKARQEALKPVRDDAKGNLARNGNIETRQLISKVTIAEGNKSNQSLVAIKRGRGGKMNRNPVRYAHLVEFGTAPHWQPNRFGGSMHPGARPFPYMRPAFEANKNGMVKAYFSVFWTAALTKAGK